MYAFTCRTTSLSPLPVYYYLAAYDIFYMACFCAAPSMAATHDTRVGAKSSASGLACARASMLSIVPTCVFHERLTFAEHYNQRLHTLMIFRPGKDAPSLHMVDPQS